MEENYEMKDFPYDLEENDETKFMEGNDETEFIEGNGKAKQIDALSVAIRERKNEFAEYRDLLLKQSAVLKLLKEENTRLKKNLVVSNRQSYNKSVEVSEKIITPLREELVKKKETTSRMLENVNRGNHILNRQREIINKQSEVIDALEKENKTLRDAEWIKMENTELKKTVDRSSQTDKWINFTDDVIKKMTDTTEVAEMSHKIFTLRRTQELWDLKSFFTDILDLEPQCTDERFLNYLMNERGLQINTHLLTEKTDYSVRYSGVDYQTIDRQLSDNDAESLRYDIRKEYDKFMYY